MDQIKLITFKIGKQRLALPIDKVREIIRNLPILPSPAWSGLLHGIINIRDSIIPVLDLRLVLSENEPVDNKNTRIMIVELLNHGAGLIVDQVDNIIPLTKEQIVPLSSISWEKKTAVLAGVAKIEQEMYLVLDINYLIQKEEQKLFKEICLKLKEDK